MGAWTKRWRWRIASVCVGLMVSVGRGHVVFADAAPQDAHRYVIRVESSRPVLRLYRDGRIYRVYPIALGKPETQSPIGSWRIVDKQQDWGGGFGTRWLGLNVPWGTYGIHGTNRPWSIGQYASNGCLRMHNGDVEQLYDLVPIGTCVIITGNPLKNARVLEDGNIGADVFLVQRRLHQLGYYRGVCDGRFGATTQFGLLYFELSRGLPMDGQVGREDYLAMGLMPGSIQLKQTSSTHH